MKLYTIIGSANCRKVHAVINHLGLEVEFVYLDWLEGEIKKSPYLAINPNGRVPTLRDGDFTLWESNAICQYLAEQRPGTSLYPAAPRTRADIARWQSWETAHFNRELGWLIFETVLKPNFLKQSASAEAVATLQRDLATFAQVLESHLEGRTHLVGSDITLGDYALIKNDGYRRAVPFDWSVYPNVNAYFDRISAVPHWSRTAPSDPAAVGRRPAGAAPLAA